MPAPEAPRTLCFPTHPAFPQTLVPHQSPFRPPVQHDQALALLPEDAEQGGAAHLERDLVPKKNVRCGARSSRRPLLLPQQRGFGTTKTEQRPCANNMRRRCERRAELRCLTTLIEYFEQVIGGTKHICAVQTTAAAACCRGACSRRLEQAGARLRSALWVLPPAAAELTAGTQHLFSLDGSALFSTGSTPVRCTVGRPPLDRRHRPLRPWLLRARYRSGAGISPARRRAGQSLAFFHL